MASVLAPIIVLAGLVVRCAKEHGCVASEIRGRHLLIAMS